ncbi:MAG: 30S ribosomal protein S19 [Candidatus Vidania fulgoroideorum]
MSKFKEPFCSYKLIKKINNYLIGKIKTIKTWSRSSFILPRFVGLTIYIHNGKKHIPIKINEYMIGHKLGEFVITRNFKGHPIKNKKEIKNKKKKIIKK